MRIFLVVTCFTVGCVAVTQAETNDVLTAIADAKRDAKAAASIVKWNRAQLIGCGIGAPLLILGAIASGYGDPEDNLYMTLGCLGVAAIAVPIGYAFYHTPTPPPKRLIGKTPAYIAAYTKTYNNAVKKRRLF